MSYIVSQFSVDKGVLRSDFSGETFDATNTRPYEIGPTK